MTERQEPRPSPKREPLRDAEAEPVIRRWLKLAAVVLRGKPVPEVR